MSNYYRVLGLKKDANETQIKAAYKKLALAHNPKRRKPKPMLSPSEHAQEQIMREQADDLESLQMFTMTAEAYDVLTDPMRKAIFDQFGEKALKEGLPGPDGFIPAYAFHGDPFRTFSEFFGTDNPFADLLSASCAPLDMMASKDAQGFHPKEPPVFKELPLTLDEAYKGAIKKLMISKKTIKEGGGTELRDKVLTVMIPPGTTDGMQFSFINEGDQGPNTQPSDIIFVTKVEKHPIFTRDGDNLSMQMDAKLCDALCGFLVSVDTLDGRHFKVLNAHVAEPGYEKVVTGEGMPVFGEPGKKGDLIIRFNIKYPTKLNSSQKNLLRSALCPPTK